MSKLLWKIITYIGIIVAPRTKLNVPKDDFPIPLNYIDVQRQTKNTIDAHEATIDDGKKMETCRCLNPGSV